jgi:hypothetical protein
MTKYLVFIHAIYGQETICATPGVHAKDAYSGCFDASTDAYVTKIPEHKRFVMAKLSRLFFDDYFDIGRYPFIGSNLEGVNSCLLECWANTKRMALEATNLHHLLLILLSIFFGKVNEQCINRECSQIFLISCIHNKFPNHPPNPLT